MLTRLIVGALALLAPVEAIWPMPQEITTGDSVLFIDQTLEITYNGASVAYTAAYEPPAGPTCENANVVRGGVSRALDAIFQKNFVPWKIRPRDGGWEPNRQDNKKRVTSLSISIPEDAEDGTCYGPRAGEFDESYTLELTEDGAATIEAETAIGVVRALESFVQLFYQHSTGTAWYTQSAPVSVRDEPEYDHRGILLDAARSWYPVADILRTIDALSMNKMNVLHIHMTDTQSWPLEIPALPELAEKGSYGPGLTYSPDDLARIQRYASHRGVQVIVEVGMPSHAGAIHHAYPELIVAYDERPYQWWCAQPPCGALKLNSTEVDGFLETLFDDLLPRMAPYTSYFHTGGDELNKNDSMLDEGVRSNDTEVIRPLLQNFLTVNHDRIRDAGLTPFVWEEMAIEWDQDLGDDVVVQSWLGADSVKTLAERGQKVIDTNYNFWYLDCGRGAWLDFPDGASSSMFYPYNDWCGPTKSWALVYSHDPRAGLSAEAAKNVLGGEVAMWSESIEPTTFDSIAWPRACAAGEVLWSGRQDANGDDRSLLDARPRLSDMRERMVARGINAAQITQLWCLQQDDPMACAHVV